MLEVGGVLRTWAVEGLPGGWSAGEGVVAERLHDHRLDYLDYEGPVSGDRGDVRRLDAGTFTVKSDTGDAFEAELSGQVLRGTVTLQRAGYAWRLTWR